MQNTMEGTNKVIVVSQKNLGLSLILTIIFGPLGMLYSTIMGGIIMIIVSFIVMLLTFGMGIFFTWPVCVIWGTVAVVNHNKKAAIAPAI